MPRGRTSSSKPGSEPGYAPKLFQLGLEWLVEVVLLSRAVEELDFPFFLELELLFGV